MAINLNVERYGAQFSAFVNFAKANASNEDTLACIDGGGLLDPDGKPRTIVAKTDDDRIKSLMQNQFFSRNDDQARLNDAVRDLFKETVFKVCGAKNFNELPPAVRDVMKETDYKVNGGHPLSVRRITAVTNAIKAEARIEDARPAIEEKYEKPAFLTGMKSELKDKFMSFYSAKLDGFAENGGPSKDEFDNVLSTLFNRTRGVRRNVLVELIACGKIAIPVVDGRLPEGRGLSQLDADVKAILESFKSVNNHNETLYDIALNTVKATSGTLAPGDVGLTGDEMYDLREAAAGVDLSALLSAEGDAGTLGRALGEFKEKVYAEFDRRFHDELAKHSATKLAIMKNIFMHYAIMQPGIKSAAFNGIVSQLGERYGELVKERDTRQLLDLIVPSIEAASYSTIAKDADAE